MPTPSTKKIIALEVSGATATTKVRILNDTQGWNAVVTCNSAGEVLYILRS